MLFEKERKDSILFKQTPNYIAKTDNDGHFDFPNVKAKDYKMVALTGFNFIYNEGDKIAFLDIVKTINMIFKDKDFKKYARKKPKTIKDIQIADNWARLKTMTMCV